MAESEIRGSERIRLNLKTRTFEEKELNRLIDFFAEKGIGLEYVFPIGKPFPELISGKFTVSPEAVGDVVKDLLGLEVATFRTIKLFPRGIPPEQLQVSVEFESAAKY
jgi:hypothetical protein